MAQTIKGFECKRIVSGEIFDLRTLCLRFTEIGAVRATDAFSLYRYSVCDRHSFSVRVEAIYGDKILSRD